MRRWIRGGQGRNDVVWLLSADERRGFVESAREEDGGPYDLTDSDHALVLNAFVQTLYKANPGVSDDAAPWVVRAHEEAEVIALHYDEVIIQIDRIAAL